MILDYTNISTRGASQDVEVGTEFAAAGETYKVRITIHHDTIYAEQSTARAAVWSTATLSWNEIATYHPGQWARGSRRPVVDGPMTEGAQAALDELRARVQATLS